MIYELVRPIIRTSIADESKMERNRSKMNLKTQQMTATLKHAEQHAKEILASTSTQPNAVSRQNKGMYNYNKKQNEV